MGKFLGEVSWNLMICVTFGNFQHSDWLKWEVTWLLNEILRFGDKMGMTWGWHQGLQRGGHGGWHRGQHGTTSTTGQSLLTSLLIYFNLRLCRMKLSSMSDVLNYDIRLNHVTTYLEQTSAVHLVKRCLDTSDRLPGFCPRVSYSFVSSTDGKFKEHKIPKLHRSVLSHCRQLQGSCDNSRPAFQYFFQPVIKRVCWPKKLSLSPELTPINLEGSIFLFSFRIWMNDLSRKCNSFSRTATK